MKSDTFIDPTNIHPHLYHNPTNVPELREFSVQPTDPHEHWIIYYGQEYQEIMYEAWCKQFAGTFTADQIAQTVRGPEDQEYTPYTFYNLAQMKRLQSGNVPGEPAYVHAEVTLDDTFHDLQRYWRVGVGKADIVDGRSRVSKAITGKTVDNQLADISNVFVRPELRAGYRSINTQRNGFGTAILHSLLDAFPDEMPTVIYDYPKNKEVGQLLTERLGFVALKTWQIELFGTQVAQTRYGGLNVSELRTKLESHAPWLARRQLIKNE